MSEQRIYLDNVPKGTTERQDDPAERFPEGIHFDIKIHPGSYLIRNGSALEDRLRKTIQREWVVMAEGLKVDPREFPVGTVHFWAPSRSEDELRELRGGNAIRFLKAKEQLHRMRTPQQLDRGLGTVDYRRSTRSLVHLRLDENAEIEDSAVAHELMHILARKKGVAHLPNYGQVLNEGVASAGQLLIEGFPNIFYPSEEYIDAQFSILKEAVEKENKWEFKGYRPADPEEIPMYLGIEYELANAALHLYLLMERGGFDQMGKLNLPFWRLLDFKQAFVMYERVYGRSFVNLLEDAKGWYKNKLREAGSLR
jgi:hypothetical protein